MVDRRCCRNATSPVDVVNCDVDLQWIHAALLSQLSSFTQCAMHSVHYTDAAFNIRINKFTISVWQLW